MKKLLLVLLALITLTLSFKTTNAQIRQGTMMFDAFYGASLTNMYWNSIIKDDAISSNISTLGPLGVRFEYLTTDLLGLGLDVVHRKMELSETYNSGSFVYRDTYTVIQTRIMARVNFHFVTTDNLDYYLGFGAGLKIADRTYSSTDPDGMEASMEALFPVAFRISTGIRYFFTENIGVNAEVGIGGGSFATAGVSFKI